MKCIIRNRSMVIMRDSRSGVLDDNSIEMASSSDAIADFSQVETTRRRSVSPTFLRALGLMKVATKETTVTSVPLHDSGYMVDQPVAKKAKKKKKKKKKKKESVPLSESRGTETDKKVGGSHTSTSKELIRPHEERSQSESVAASSTTQKTFVVKEKHVSKSKDRAKKRSHVTSFDEPQSKPVVVVKKTRKPAAPATDKPTTSKREVSPPATKVSPSAPKSTGEPAENLSEFTGAADERMWSDILESDFKSIKYTMLLKNNQFTEEQVEAIRKSMQNMCRMFCRRPTKRERFMKTHECIECHYSISHECASVDSTQYWTFGGNAPFIDFISPEVITMCLCNFTIFHSHKVQENKSKPRSKRKAESPERSPLPRRWPLVENNRSVYLECPKCYINITVTNRNKDPCSDLRNFIDVAGSIRRKFSLYIHTNLDFGSTNYPSLSEFYSCENLCCMLFHRCAREVIVRSSMPIQPHRPITWGHPSK